MARDRWLEKGVSTDEALGVLQKALADHNALVERLVSVVRGEAAKDCDGDADSEEMAPDEKRRRGLHAKRKDGLRIDGKWYASREKRARIL